MFLIFIQFVQLNNLVQFDYLYPDPTYVTLSAVFVCEFNHDEKETYVEWWIGSERIYKETGRIYAWESLTACL